MEGIAGKKQVGARGMRATLVLLGIVALLMGLVSTGCSSATESGSDVATEESSEQAAEEPASKYAITDEQLVDQGYGMYTITGTLTNNSGKSLDYVQVEYVLKDASGAQIGTGLANTNNLADGSAWKYEAYCSSSSDEAPATFELVEVTGF